jgi:succinoglycan biosynthesis protein ExoO
MTALVSVIIPAFNAEAFLDRAVASVLQQSWQNFEIIVVNDGSLDGTAGLIARLAATDRRLIQIDLRENLGVSAARNVGLRRATGDWLALLDADDEFLPTRIGRLVEIAEQTGADMVADNLQMRRFPGQTPLGLAFPEAWMAPGRDVSLRYLLARDIAGIHRRELAYIKPMFRRAFLAAHGISYRPGLAASEDLLFYVDCLRAGARLRLTPEALYLYHLRDGSVSSTGAANLAVRQANVILQAMFAQTDPAITSLLRLRLAAVDFELLIWHLRQADFSSALAAASRMPSRFLAAKLLHALARRLGRPALNPAAKWLDHIRRDHGQGF